MSAATRYSVEGLCNQIARSRLLGPDAVRALRQRWRAEAGAAADDGEKFGRWLVGQRELTDFQLGLLGRGFADMLFFGEYKLLERIGQGRMAGVYKANHPTGQVVAIKVLPPSKAANPQLLGRFQREARLALRLKHANVVRTFQRGRTRAGLHYLVMEYLEGETLDEVLRRRKRLPVAEAAALLVQAFQGLQYLHEEGLIHRDLKPGNLMLVAAPGADAPDSTLGRTVKILDIGLGRALFDFDEGLPGGADNPDLTAEGSLLGTPNYMAPEQARTAHLADIRSDIYSLGCVLYEALTGGPPFPDTSFLRQMVRHATEAPRPLHEAGLVVPEGLQEVVDALLAKDPARRYSTPAQAARALGRFATTGEPALQDTAPPMRSYLTWLETKVPEPEDGPAGAPAGEQPASSLPAWLTLETVGTTPAPPVPVAVAAPVARRLPGADQAAVADALPVAVPLALGADAEVTRKSAVGEWRRRDLLAAAIGAGGLLLAELVLWLVWRLLAQF